MRRRSFLQKAGALGLGGILCPGLSSHAEEAIAERKAAAAGPSSLRFSTDFEGGSVGKVVEATECYIRCILVGEVDQNGQNRQVSWFYFRMDGAPDSELTIDFTDLGGEYNGHPGNHAITADTPAVYSYDGRRWAHVERKDWTAVGSSMRLRFKPAKSRLWIAHVPPYTNCHLARLLEIVKHADVARYKVIGKSVQGRDIPLLTITDSGNSRKSKKFVWLMFRQHSWEAGSSWVGEGAVRFLLSSDPDAVRIRKDTVFNVLPMQDPDGVFRGGVRFNAYGYDLNRNWGVTDPVKMPEIAAARNAILNWPESGSRIDFFLTLHDDQTNESLSGPPSGKFDALGQKVLAEITRTTSFDPSRGYRADPDPFSIHEPRRMDVVGGLCFKRSIPAFLMEQKICYSGKLRRFPTVKDRLEFGKGLVKAIRASLDT